MSYINKTGLSRLWKHIITKLENKVDKVDGKSLSTNDFTTEEKEKLAGMARLVGDTSVSEQISTVLSTHNTAVDAHSDIRDQIADAKAACAPLEHEHDDYSFAGHIHSAIALDVVEDEYDYSTTVYPMDDGQNPCVVIEKDGQRQFAIRKDGNTIGYHRYEDGVWKGYDMIFSTANKPTAYDVQTGGTLGQLCAVNSDGSISPYTKTIADLYTTDQAIESLNTLVGDKTVTEQISDSLGSYVVPVSLGGTGATDAATALTSLGAAPSNHYHTEYAPNSHSHASVVSGSNVLYAMDNGDTPCVAMERNGQNQFALSRDALSNQALGYHTYTDGAWAAYHTLFSSANLSFVLDGTTLNITKS